MEQWKTLWWNTRYEVSNLGRVRNRKSGKILATNPTKSHKKPQVWLYTDYFNSTLQYTLDKLVYFTFNGVSSRSEVKRVKHRDGNVMNCKLDNLYILYIMVVSYFFATPIINYAELFREQSNSESPNGYFKGGKKR